MIVRRLICGLILFVGLGCDRNGSSASYEPCDAVGVVTFEGKSISSGMVTYVPTIPESAGGHPGIASLDAEGRYHLGNAEHGRAKMLAPGEYVVTIVSMNIDHNNGPPAPKLAIPERYANATETPLRVTLVPGENKVDLKLVR